MKGGRSVEDINVLWNTSPWKDWHWYALADSCSDSKALSTSFAKTQYKISHTRASFNENSYRKLVEKKQIRKNHIVNCRQTSAVCINVFPHHTHTHTHLGRSQFHFLGQDQFCSNFQKNRKARVLIQCVVQKCCHKSYLQILQIASKISLLPRVHCLIIQLLFLSSYNTFLAENLDRK